MKLSPKVLAPLAISILAALVIWLLTGDETWLLGIMVSLVAGGAGVAVKPAPEVTQDEVNQLSRRKRGLPPGRGRS